MGVFSGRIKKPHKWGIEKAKKRISLYCNNANAIKL